MRTIADGEGGTLSCGRQQASIFGFIIPVSVADVLYGGSQTFWTADPFCC